uniref:Uncharacterized protein n=1 Tax=Timema douglasi TaxID=61478 RepID=A0A7R8Z9N6_TIMDO|nr:unnamed protein product [Timema douglasi]
MDPPPDPRLEYIGSYVTKTLKLKPEKWGRLVATEELKTMVCEFLNFSEPLGCILRLPLVSSTVRLYYESSSGEFYCRAVLMVLLQTQVPQLPLQVLVILQNSAAQLQVATSFPLSLKSKAAYFIKKRCQPVPKEDISDHLILGDMATKPIEQLAALVDEVGTSGRGLVWGTVARSSLQ